MSTSPARPLRGALAPLAVTLILLATATIASAAPSQPTRAPAQFQIAAPASAAPASPLSRSTDAKETTVSAEGGGCWVTTVISSCMDVRSTLAPDFYVHSLSGWPEGTRYDVLVVSETGELWVVAKGILNHTGHYGAWRVDTASRAYTAVVISDPSGGTVYLIATSPWAKK